MFFRQIFDDKLAQNAYLIGCQQTGDALVIDPQRDIDRYVALAKTEELRIVAVAETHIHADFLSGAREFAERFGTRVYLSDEGDENWKYTWPANGDYDAVLLSDGDTFGIGRIELTARHTPGHTPEHLAFLLVDRGSGASEPMGLVSGDFVFVGDVGRPDLLETAAKVSGAREPSARRLWASIQRFLELPEYLQVWPGHGAGSACGKALGAVPETTVGYEKRFSPAIDRARRGEEPFVRFILEGQPEPPLYFARMKR
ncbi:MAG: MBL fold metallo-hydrolase, partial [Gemmatimonadota bacterium]